MSHRIEYRPAAARFLHRLRDRRLRQRLTDAIGRLAVDPRPVGATKLSGFPYFRIRVGDHRIIYRVLDDQLLVLILTIAHRREAYR